MSSRNPPAGTPDMSQDEMAAALRSVRTACAKKFGLTNPDRVAQLDAALSTAAMAVDHLHTETPYRLGEN